MEKFNKSKVTKCFDNIAQEYNDQYYGKGDIRAIHSFLIRKQRVLEIYNKEIKKKAKILDIGCGPGIIIEELLSKNAEIYGIDISKEMINLAKKKFPNVNFSVGDAENIKFPNNTFDVVISMGLIEYLKNDIKAITESIRVLKKDGILILTVPNQKSIHRIISRFGKRLLNKKTKLDHKEYSMRFIKKIAKFNNSVVEDYSYYNFRIFPIDILFKNLSVKISRFLEKFEKSPIETLGTGFIVKIRKK